MLLHWAAFGDQWSKNHKVTFDGVNRLIIVSEFVTEIDIKTDIYSDWKEWVQLYDNSKFLPAVRTIGGDPVGAGLFAGDIYFLINDWKVLVSNKLNVNGILYDNNPGESPYIIQPGAGVIASVSNLAYAVSTLSETITNQDIMNSLNEIISTMSTLAKEESSQKILKAAKLAAAMSI